MTLFIKLENGLPVGNAILEENFKKLFPKTSFPKYFTADVVEPLGYGIYDFRNQPEPGKYQKVVEVTPKKSEFGIWLQTWQLVEMDDSEKSVYDEQTAQRVRSKRGSLLAETDFYGLTDVTMTQEMTQYRQALRDITDHENFPYLSEDDWPTKP